MNNMVIIRPSMCHDLEVITSLDITFCRNSYDTIARHNGHINVKKCQCFIDLGKNLPQHNRNASKQPPQK
ncbi:hypothetical protein SAR116_2498 [Candidatus Puniceispirillum marinum IMCC1322]|uniref:Uncharacterized protein n=1 Tax=Puniceispirillum marinum (strain IMCC1322) TaxID=488538 RepID=D5BQM3_PUNMI|nr:hypothetical protein SAR116_2498 [Candidatus Puniceispirillum marinum IMCC1322]